MAAASRAVCRLPTVSRVEFPSGNQGEADPGMNRVGAPASKVATWKWETVEATVCDRSRHSLFPHHFRSPV